MERQTGVGRRANESPLAGLNRGLSVHTLVHVAAPLVGADGVGRGKHVQRRIRAAHAPPIWRPQGIAPTRHPQGRGAGTVCDAVSAPPMHRRSGDHKGSTLHDPRRRETREPCTTMYPRRPCTADRATTGDRPYKTPAEEGRENDGVVSPAPVCHRRLRHCSARVPRLRWRMGL